MTIYHGDCRDILPLLEPGSIDLVLTDPPYNIGFDGYTSYRDRLPDEQYIEMLQEMERFPRVVVTHYPEETMIYLCSALGPPEHVGVWCYNSNTPRRFRLINYWGVKPDYGRIRQPYKNRQDRRIQKLMAAGFEGGPLYEWWTDIPIVKNVSEEKTEHPCPLPVKLVSRIMRLTTEPHWCILDPFMGSGTTLRAAKDLGRRAIGIEISEDYCRIAARRMAQTVLPLEVSP